MTYKAWEGFVPGKWSDDEVNVRDFIQRNYTPYDGDDSFLEGPTEATKKLWQEILELSEKERAAGGVLKADTSIVCILTGDGQTLPPDTARISKWLKVRCRVDHIKIYLEDFKDNTPKQ